MPSRAVVWFRRDLRVADHPALVASFLTKHPLIDWREAPASSSST
jgi:deoxyribodipyrimidine photolyase